MTETTTVLVVRGSRTITIRHTGLVLTVQTPHAGLSLEACLNVARSYAKAMGIPLDGRAEITIGAEVR